MKTILILCVFVASSLTLANEELDRRVFFAVETNNPALLETTLKAGGNANAALNQSYADGLKCFACTPLFHAFKQPVLNEGILKILIDHKANPEVVLSLVKDSGELNSRVYGQWNLLGYFIFSKATIPLTKLLSFGVDLNAKSQEKFRPLEIALRTDQPKVFDLLLSKGAKLQEDGFNLVMTAYQSPLEDAVKLVWFKKLFALKIDMDNSVWLDSRKKHQTPLSFALTFESPDYVNAELFLKAGASPTALGVHRLVLDQQNLASFALLLKYRLDVKKEDLLDYLLTHVIKSKGVTRVNFDFLQQIIKFQPLTNEICTKYAAYLIYPSVLGLFLSQPGVDVNRIVPPVGSDGKTRTLFNYLMSQIYEGETAVRVAKILLYHAYQVQPEDPFMDFAIGWRDNSLVYRLMNTYHQKPTLEHLKSVIAASGASPYQETDGDFNSLFETTLSGLSDLGTDPVIHRQLALSAVSKFGVIDSADVLEKLYAKGLKLDPESLRLVVETFSEADDDPWKTDVKFFRWLKKPQMALGVVKQIVANATEIDPTSGFYLVTIASRLGSLDLVRTLVDKKNAPVEPTEGVKPKFPYNGLRPLHEAVLSEKTELIEMILQRVKDVNQVGFFNLGISTEYRGYYAGNALGLLVFKVQTPKTLALLRTLLRMDLSATQGITGSYPLGIIKPIHIAKSLPIIDALLEAGADLNEVTQRGGKTFILIQVESAIYYRFTNRQEQMEFLDSLFKRYPQIDCKKTSTSPFDLALKAGDNELAQLLARYQCM